MLPPRKAGRRKLHDHFMSIIVKLHNPRVPPSVGPQPETFVQIDSWGLRWVAVVLGWWMPAGRRIGRKLRSTSNVALEKCCCTKFEHGCLGSLLSRLNALHLERIALCAGVASMFRMMLIQMTVKCVTMDEDIFVRINCGIAGKLPLASTSRRDWMAQFGPDLNLQPALVWAQQLTRNGHVEAQRGARTGQVGYPSKLAARKNRGCLVSLLPPPRKRPQDEPCCAGSTTNAKANPTLRRKLNARKAKAISIQGKKNFEKYFSFETCDSDQVQSHKCN